MPNYLQLIFSQNLLHVKSDWQITCIEKQSIYKEEHLPSNNILVTLNKYKCYVVLCLVSILCGKSDGADH